MGRLWQILLFAGLIAWLLIVYRAAHQHLKLRHKDDFNALIWFYLFSAVLVVGFFGFGLFYGRGTHLTLADYWRWFVVHISVESIFEFFGVAVIALLMVAMGLASAKEALVVSYFTAAFVFLSGSIGAPAYPARHLSTRIISSTYSLHKRKVSAPTNLTAAPSANNPTCCRRTR